MIKSVNRISSFLARIGTAIDNPKQRTTKMNNRWIFLAFIFSGAVFGLPGATSMVDQLETIYVDSERYTIPAEDLALLNKTEGATGVYHPTKKFDALEFKQGAILTFENGTLGRRSGNQQFVSYGGYSCTTGTEVAAIRNFGCGQCIAWTGCNCNGALSALLSMQTTGNPKPTASIFSSGHCQGPYQSIGIAGGRTRSCTNSRSGDFFSAIVYYNC